MTAQRSLWLLIDGYNVVKPSAAPRRDPEGWLARERRLLVDRLVDHLPASVRQRTRVVFDAKSPPPDVENRYVHQGIVIDFAVHHEEADDLIEEIIAAHSAAKWLTVVSSDQRIAVAAKRRGATVWDSDAWLDRLMAGRLELCVDRSKIDAENDRDDAPPLDDATSLRDDDVDQWLDEFGF